MCWLVGDMRESLDGSHFPLITGVAPRYCLCASTLSPCSYQGTGVIVISPDLYSPVRCPATPTLPYPTLPYCCSTAMDETQQPKRQAHQQQPGR